MRNIHLVRVQKILIQGFKVVVNRTFGSAEQFGSVRHISKESSVWPNSDPKVRPNRTEPNF